MGFKHRGRPPQMLESNLPGVFAVARRAREASSGSLCPSAEAPLPHSYELFTWNAVFAVESSKSIDYCHCPNNNDVHKKGSQPDEGKTDDKH
jgi:hypothetical protein